MTERQRLLDLIEQQRQDVTNNLHFLGINLPPECFDEKRVITSDTLRRIRKSKAREICTQHIAGSTGLYYLAQIIAGIFGVECSLSPLSEASSNKKRYKHPILILKGDTTETQPIKIHPTACHFGRQSLLAKNRHEHGSPGDHSPRIKPKITGADVRAHVDSIIERGGRLFKGPQRTR